MTNKKSIVILAVVCLSELAAMGASLSPMAQRLKGVTADDVDKYIGYSHPKFNQLFNEELGHTVKKEFLLQRTRLACSLLRETDYSIGEIAMRCGYRRAQYFVSSFSETFKMTPETGRKRHAIQKV